MQVHPSGATAATEVLGGFLGPFGAYVHVPFCERICPFCPYNKVLACTAPVDRYFAALGEEIARYRSAMARLPTSLYIGGGTPSLYPDRVAAIVEWLPVTGERAVEVLPTHATPERLARLAEAGITYVSIGAQSFDDGVLRHLRRPHSAADNRAALDHAAGRFDCVDVDLIFDTAYADSATFLRDVRYCFEHEVDQVSTYPLMRFGYTPFGKSRHDRRTEHRMLHQVGDLAAEHGYERRSVWTFNRFASPSYTSITRELVLGMGASGATFSGTEFRVNHFGIRTYIDGVESGELPIARSMHLGPVGGAAYYLFWQLYTGTVDLDRLGLLFGAPGTRLARAVAAAAAVTPLASRQGPFVRLTPRGFDGYHDLERLVTYQLIEPLWAELMQEHVAEGRGSGRAPGAGWIQTTPGRPPYLWRTVERLLRTRR